MEAIAFGRGVKPVGLNNEVKGGQYESTFSEMNWQSQDGSSLPGILFATGTIMVWRFRLMRQRQKLTGMSDWRS